MSAPLFLQEVVVRLLQLRGVIPHGALVSLFCYVILGYSVDVFNGGLDRAVLKLLDVLFKRRYAVFKLPFRLFESAHSVTARSVLRLGSGFFKSGALIPKKPSSKSSLRT